MMNIQSSTNFLITTRLGRSESDQRILKLAIRLTIFWFGLNQDYEWNSQFFRLSLLCTTTRIYKAYFAVGHFYCYMNFQWITNITEAHSEYDLVILVFLFYYQKRLYICSDNFRYISLNGLVKSISELQLHTVIWYLLFVPLNT